MNQRQRLLRHHGWKNGSKKLLLFCLLLYVFTGNAFAQNQLDKPVTISVTQQKISQFISLLQKQAGITFSYSPNAIQSDRLVTYSATNKKLSEVLSEAFKTLSINYRLDKNQVLLFPSTVDPLKITEPGMGATSGNRTVTGTVLDSRGQPVAGVTVTVKGGQATAMTGANGSYSIAAPANGVLAFTAINYDPSEQVVGANGAVNASLNEKSTNLNDVVVVGYGTRTKKDLTGTVNSIQSEEIVKARATNAQEAMQGKLPGVDIRRSSGKPGADFNIEIRGANSITGSTQPLYVVDGIPVGQNGSATNPINDINPADIERIDVLKDASSTAIYGSRGANGVILVTTKRGTRGAAKISYDGYVGIVNPYHLPPLMNGPTFVTYARDFYNALAGYPATPITDDKIFSATELTNIKNGTYTDWVDLIKRNGMSANHNISVSGGDAKTTYFLSGGYQQYQGTVQNESTKKYTLKAGLDKTAGAFRFGGSIIGTFADIKPSSGEAFRSAYRLRPTGSAYNADGSERFFAYESEAQITNPLFDFRNEIRQQQYVHVLPNVYAEVGLPVGFRLRTSFSPDITLQRTGLYADTYTKMQAGTRPNIAQNSSTQWVNYTWDNLLTYNKQFGSSKLDVALGNTTEYHQQDFSTTSAQGLPFRSLWYNLQSATTVNGTVPIVAITSGYSKQNIQSFYGRANYNLNSRYLFTFTMRADGNSIFAANHKWGYFPSGAFAWIVSEENFMQSVKAIDFLKLRLSYGKSGNAALSGSLYPYVTQSSLNQSLYDFNGNGANGFSPAFGNNNLTWEKTDEYNAGFDMQLLKSRIGVQLDVYRKTSKGSILAQPIPAANGYIVTTTNLGSVRNQGIEAAVNTVNIKTRTFTWNTSFNFATNHNKILELYGDGKDDIVGGRFLGQKSRVVYNYKILGVYQTSEAADALAYGLKPGQYKVMDVNGDKKIDANDRVILGSDMPKWFGGVTSNMNYKNFDLSVTLYTRQGTYENSIFLEQALNGDQNRARFNAFDRSYWTPTNPNNEWANQAIETSDRRLIKQFQNSSYTKISNIVLGYNFPTKMIQKIKLQNARFYANVFNPFIFSKFIGWDPENPSGSSFLNQDFRTRTLMLGLNLTL